MGHARPCTAKTGSLTSALPCLTIISMDTGQRKLGGMETSSRDGDTVTLHVPYR